MIKTSFTCLKSAMEFKFEPRFRLLNKILICVGIKHVQCVYMKTFTVVKLQSSLIYSLTIINKT